MPKVGFIVFVYLLFVNLQAQESCGIYTSKIDGNIYIGDERPIHFFVALSKRSVEPLYLQYSSIVDNLNMSDLITTNYVGYLHSFISINNQPVSRKTQAGFSECSFALYIISLFKNILNNSYKGVSICDDTIICLDESKLMPDSIVELENKYLVKLDELKKYRSNKEIYADNEEVNKIQVREEIKRTKIILNIISLYETVLIK